MVLTEWGWGWADGGLLNQSLGVSPHLWPPGGHSGDAGYTEGRCEVDWWVCRREGNGDRSPETCFWRGGLERGLWGLLVKMVLHQWFFETHEKMKQLHFSPRYKNISRTSVSHISILRAPLVHRLSVIRRTRRCDWTKPTRASLGEDSEVPRLCVASCCPWLCLG